MKPDNNLQQQLRSLSISREQRPVIPNPQAGRRRVYLLIAGAVLLLLGGYFGWPGKSGTQGDAPAPAQSSLVLVSVSRERGSEATAVLTATGKIVSDHQVKVATKVSGQIVALYFEQGDRIERSQLLARIEDTIYRARRDEAVALLAKAKATHDYQKVNFARVSKLHEQQQAPEIEYAEARRGLEEAQAQESASAALLAEAEKSLRDCEVLAPIGGVVLERNVEVGDFVAAEGGRGAMANSQLATIADMEKLRVEVDVSEMDIGRLRKGMPCRIAPDAHKERQYRGRLLWIDPGANYAKATVQVKVRIEGPDDCLRVEGAAQVRFLDAEPDGATSEPATPGRESLWIPATACRLDADGRSGRVYVVVEGRLREALIKIGQRKGDRLEVVEGLREEQQIAADARQAKEGQVVQK